MCVLPSSPPSTLTDISRAVQSHHITTLLASVSVTSLSDPDSTSFLPLTATNPPFVVVGSAERPFLARVELGFSGVGIVAGGAAKEKGREQTVVLEHWVDVGVPVVLLTFC